MIQFILRYYILVMFTLALKCLERCVLKAEQNRLFIGRLPRLPLVTRELECIANRMDRNLRLHLEERLSCVGTEIGSNLGELTILKGNVEELQDALTAVKAQVLVCQLRILNLLNSII